MARQRKKQVTGRKTRTRARAASRTKEPELTIIIPAYNEEESVAEAVEEVHRTNPSARIIVVDDGSTDRTRVILRNLALPQLSVMFHPWNFGYGAALKAALRQVRTPFVGFIDADLTYDPALFPTLVATVKREKLDIAWVDRFSGQVNEMPEHRKRGNQAISLFFKAVTGKAVCDCTSGQRVLAREAIRKLNVDTLPDGPGFIGALTKRVISRGIPYRTLPTNYRKRRGISKLNFVTGFLSIVYRIAAER